MGRRFQFFPCMRPWRHKKTKPWFAATDRSIKNIFARWFRWATRPHASKKNKIQQNLATQRTIGVRILPLPAYSRRWAQKNRRAARVLRSYALVREILRAPSASWRVARLASIRANRGRGSPRSTSRSELGCASTGCCVSSKPLSGDFLERSAAKRRFVHSSSMRRDVS
jgi:hypothetical protein